MSKRRLVQGRPNKTRFDKPVPMLTKRRRLPENATRRAIRWFGVLRTILHDPDHAEPGDLYHGCSYEVRQAFQHRIGRARLAGTRQAAKDLERREADSFTESWRKATPLTREELVELGYALSLKNTSTPP